MKWLGRTVFFLLALLVLFYFYQKNQAANAFAAQTGSLQCTLASEKSNLGNFKFDWNKESQSLSIRTKKGKMLFASIKGKSFLSAAVGRESVEEHKGSFFFSDNLSIKYENQTIESIHYDSTHFQLTGTVISAQNILENSTYTLRFWLDSIDHRLHFAANLGDSSLNRIYFTGKSDENEHFYGAGVQCSHLDLKGHRLPIWVSEQGIGRGAQPLTFAVNLVAKSGGNDETSYAPVPYFLSSHLFSFCLENTTYSILDFREKNSFQVQTWDNTMQGLFFDGANPQELVEHYATWAGRMRMLPDWVHQGAIIGMQGGTEKVRNLHQRLAEAGVPVAAFWLQDWVGQRTTSFGKQLWWNWELDTDHYPNWQDLRADLAVDSIEIMVYCNPFLVDLAEKKNVKRNLFKEAIDKGFVVKTPENQVSMAEITSFSAAMIDLENPAAVAWLSKILKENLISTGAKGWMADFGEALPYTAQLFSKKAGRKAHNTYPEQWAKLNRALIDSLDHGDEYVFFMRSGYTHSPADATLFWLGDQMVTWDEHDGLQSAVTGMITSGLSGFSYQHSDIGGYTAITNFPFNKVRSPELLLRWMEVAALSPVFRTHEGNRPTENAQFYSDSASFSHFATCAKLFLQLFDYRKIYIQEAALHGTPVIRPMWLHYPQCAEATDLKKQYLLGRDLLVAPVMEAGAQSVRVWLPPGAWQHHWSKRAFFIKESAGKWIEIDAPLGNPAMFWRKDTTQ